MRWRSDRSHSSDRTEVCVDSGGGASGCLRRLPFGAGLCEDGLDRGGCIGDSGFINGSRVDCNNRLGCSLVDRRLAHGLAAAAAKFVLRSEANSFRYDTHPKHTK